MVKFKFEVVITLILALSFSCENDSPVRYNLDSSVDQLLKESNGKDSIQVDLCSIITADWDSILVVSPYTVLSRQEDLRELANFSSIESDINDIEYSDMMCYLLFVKSKKVIGYGEVTRTPFDFVASFPPVGKKLGVIKGSDCEKLYIRRGRRKLFVMP